MSLRMILLSAAVAVSAITGWPFAGIAQDRCSSSAQQRVCSQQCCGRTSCAPACQSDCVRACIDACRAPQAQPSFQAQLSDMRQRCGYAGGK